MFNDNPVLRDSKVFIYLSLRTLEEYEKTKTQRQAWRDRINELEAKKVE